MTIVQDHIKRLKQLKDVTIEAGWFESARYQAGKDVPAAQVGMSVARVARINEFGATIKTAKANIVIPARPFMRGAYMQIKAKRDGITKKIAKQIVEGKIKPEQAFIQIGLFMEGEIVESIKNGGWVANAPSTVKRKGFDKPLIHTGQMWQAVASKVSEAT
jgi:hypothetical protein